MFKDHADIMQSGNEAASVSLSAARSAVTEPDNVGASLTQAGVKGEALGVIG
jgi:hypothetical protein